MNFPAYRAHIASCPECQALEQQRIALRKEQEEHFYKWVCENHETLYTEWKAKSRTLADLTEEVNISVLDSDQAAEEF